jgi:hypothetical protein
MNNALATAATAFGQTLNELGFSGNEAELGDAQELGRRGALLAVSDVIWRRQLGPLLDSRQVRELLGGVTRQAVSDLAKRGRWLALPDSRGRLRFPAFQFTQTGRPLSQLSDILQIFAPAEVSPYTVASWFMTPQSLLDDTTPAQWLGEGRDLKLAIEAARRTAARLGQ